MRNYFDVFSLLVLVAQRVERLSVSVLNDRYFRAGNCIDLLSNITLFCVSLIVNSFSSFNTTQSPATRNRCPCLISIVPDVFVSLSKFLIHTPLHHRLQLLILGHLCLLMNFQVEKFQNRFHLIRLVYSQFVQTLQNIIRWNVDHRQQNFIPSRVEFLNIVIMKSDRE